MTIAAAGGVTWNSVATTCSSGSMTRASACTMNAAAPRTMSDARSDWLMRSSYRLVPHVTGDDPPAGQSAAAQALPAALSAAAGRVPARLRAVRAPPRSGDVPQHAGALRPGPRAGDDFRDAGGDDRDDHASHDPAVWRHAVRRRVAAPVRHDVRIALR